MRRRGLDPRESQREPCAGLYERLVRRRGETEETLGAIADWMAAHPARAADPE